MRMYRGVAIVLLGAMLIGCVNSSVNQPADSATIEADHTGHDMEMTIATDLEYIDGMIVHHQGAISMAREALANATNPAIIELATEIINAQEAEVMQLNVWRESWYPDASESDVSGMDMGATEVESGAGSYDERWLQSMIAHHQAAVDMSGQLLKIGEHDELLAFAEAVIAVQTTEIKNMQAMLANQ
jgi:uncharacterized protein (DUF305 family)